MKKIFYLIPLVGMLMVSCKSDEPVATDDGNNRGEVHNSYLTVNIHPTSGYGTRADNPQGDGNYRDGNESEQKVNSIRFFFFANDGSGAPVSILSQEGDQTTYASYIDWIHNDSNLGGGIPGETVEATVSATLGLFIPENTGVPTSMIAIINPSDAVKNINTNGTYGPTMTEVQTAVADFETDLTDGNFVMSNSVYAVGDPLSTVINYTSLTPEDGNASYFQSSVEAAQANPVIVWVERVAARLDLSIAIGNTTPNANGAYPVMKKVAGTTEDDPKDDIQATVNVINPETGETEAKKVYVKFLGWNVTSTPDQSFLVKTINPAWTSKGLFGNESNIAWNSSLYHRSFWAMNPGSVNYQYGNFNGDTDTETNPQPANALTIPTSGRYTTTYMQENASVFSSTLDASAPSNPTQVIIAAQLVDENNKPFELAEWGYQKYTQGDLLTYLATNIISQGNFYKKTTDGTTTKYDKLTAGDLSYVSAAQYPGGRPATAKDYYSYVILNTAASSAEWYIKTGNGETDADFTSTTVTNINNYIMNSVGYTMSWYNGFTYYYFDVHHLGLPGSFGYNGIVRNHLYEAVVTSLYGYGTPVPDPGEIIIPQTPEYEEILLAAQIRILEWRVVRSTYDLEWK